MSVCLASKKRRGKIYIRYGRGKRKCFEGIVVLVSFLLPFTSSFDIVNFSFLSSSSKTSFLIGVCNPTYPDGLLDPSAITTRSEKFYADLPTKYSKYRALKVLKNKPIISFSNNGGLTCAANSRHLWAYSLTDSLLPFFIACKLDLSRATSILNLYCLIKASTKFFHHFTLVLSKRIYQVRAASLKLF